MRHCVIRLIVALLLWAAVGMPTAAARIPTGPASGRPSGSTSQAIPPSLRKLDALLRLVALAGPAAAREFEDIMPVYTMNGIPGVGVLVEGHVSRAEIEQLGGVYLATLGIATSARIPVTALAELAQLRSLVYAEASVWQFPFLDSAVAGTGVTESVRQDLGHAEGFSLQSSTPVSTSCTKTSWAHSNDIA